MPSSCLRTRAAVRTSGRPFSLPPAPSPPTFAKMSLRERCVDRHRRAVGTAHGAEAGGDNAPLAAIERCAAPARYANPLRGCSVARACPDNPFRRGSPPRDSTQARREPSSRSSTSTPSPSPPSPRPSAKRPHSVNGAAHRNIATEAMSPCASPSPPPSPRPSSRKSTACVPGPWTEGRDRLPRSGWAALTRRREDDDGPLGDLPRQPPPAKPEDLRAARARFEKIAEEAEWGGAGRAATPALARRHEVNASGSGTDLTVGAARAARKRPESPR